MQIRVRGELKRGMNEKLLFLIIDRFGELWSQGGEDERMFRCRNDEQGLRKCKKV